MALANALRFAPTLSLLPLLATLFFVETRPSVRSFSIFADRDEVRRNNLFLLDKALPEEGSRAKTEQNVNNLLREYRDILDDRLGEISNYEAKLKLRPGVKAKFCRVQIVPFAEKEGIIEKVDSSEWAIPVVPILKTDGSIRLSLCADYSVTLNPNLTVPQHPLPRLEKILVV
ncbi:retrovirus-related Pol polyprotein from transposon 412 [Trichonephila clavipes]|nr:retrovirus-related Pol polyprotein from transposon 412 [Trichonephila clavipes]